MLYIIDEIDYNSNVIEVAVFEENYALLCNTIKDVIDPLIKCFVREKLCTAEEEKQITAITTVQKILQSLLLKVSSLLKADDTRGFYIMLKIMKEHGSNGTKNLADHMKNRLNSLNDKLLQFCSDHVSMPNNEVKGLSVFQLNVITNKYVYVYGLLAT